MEEKNRKAVKKSAKTTGKEDGKKSVTAAKAPVSSAGSVKAAVKRKPVIRTEIAVQYQDREWTRDSLLQTVKDILKYDMQLEESIIKKVELYINTAEDRVYFVVNGDIHGNFAL